MVEQKNNIYIGIELGSTRIKTVAIDDNNRVLASGSFVWENKLIDGIWTYGMDEVKAGLKASYNALKRDYKEKTGNSLNSPSAIGMTISLFRSEPGEIQSQKRPPLSSLISLTSISPSVGQLHTYMKQC